MYYCFFAVRLASLFARLGTSNVRAIVHTLLLVHFSSSRIPTLLRTKAPARHHSHITSVKTL